MSNQSSFIHLNALKELVTTPINSYRHWGILLVIALMFVFIPQMPPPDDWQRNTAPLFNGLNIYHDPGFVYPPWTLITLWPYYLMTSAGSRIASVLVIGWLAAKRKWTLLHFGAIISTPFFLWTMVLSNVDVLALLFPVLLWESSEGKSWQWLGRSISLMLWLIKPQGSIIIIFYLIWKQRNQIKGIIVPFIIVLITTVPISLIGKPPLVVQWVRNAVISPSSENLLFWSINNVSLTKHLGVLVGILVFAFGIGGIYFLMRMLRKPWTQDHIYSSLFLASLLLGPYASNQSMIVPLAFLPAWPAVAIQYILSFTFSHFGVYNSQSSWWALLFGIIALLWYKPFETKKANEPMILKSIEP